MEQILFLIVGAAIGGLVAWLFVRANTQADKTKLIAEQEARRMAEERSAQAQRATDSAREEILRLAKEAATLKAEKSTMETQLESRQKELAETQEKMTLQFKNLANQIFEEKNQQNRGNLAEILKPFHDRIKEFENTVHQTHADSGKQFAQMGQQLAHFFDMGNKMSQEANNLSQALRGSTKVQGDWGEIALETILEKSGLEKGREFETQISYATEDGGRLRPDVIVRFPGGKSIIVDSKMSLSAYTAYVNAANDDERAAALTAHIASLRKHIRELGGKEYAKNISENSLEYVVMFVPIEPAYILALQHDENLVSEAFDRRIYLTSPSLLIPLLQLVKNAWNQDKQNKNAAEIAKRAGALYEKFRGFTEDLIKMGKQLNDCRDSYEGAMNKLSAGKGNLVNRVEELKRLGAQTSDSLHPKLLERAEE